MSEARVLALWSAPRSRSTAFFRVMAERGDLLTLHEPFCNLVDYGETDVAGEVVRSAPELIAAMTRHASRQPVFIKDTTDYRYPDVLADSAFLAGTRHAFLLRRPHEIAASYYALRPEMTRSDIGIEQMWELYQRAFDVSGTAPLVIDSDDLVAEPERTMAAYCGAVGLPFAEAALTWKPGERPEWQRSSRWHADVSASGRIEARTNVYTDTVASNPKLAEFSAHHQPFYDQLYEARMTV